MSNLPSNEFKASILIKNGIYKTTDNQYYQVIDGKLNENFKLRNSKKLPDWKYNQLLQSDTINTLFSGHTH